MSIATLHIHLSKNHCINTLNYKCTCQTSPEIIISKVIKVALLKSSLVRVAVTNRPIISGYWVDATTIGKGLPVEIDNVAEAKSSTTYKQVADVATETEQPCTGTTTDIKQIVLYVRE